MHDEHLHEVYNPTPVCNRHHMTNSSDPQNVTVVELIVQNARFPLSVANKNNSDTQFCELAKIVLCNI